MKAQESQVGLKLNGTHQLLAYADDVNLLEDNINTLKKNMGTFHDVSKVGLDRAVEEAKCVCMSVSRYQIAGQ
jgi:hypothetical protein